MRRRSTNVFFKTRTVTCGTVDGTFIRADVWLDFSRDLVSLWTKVCQGQRAGAVTVRLSPQLATPVSQRTDDHVPGQCGSRGLSGIHSITPGTTYTRSTPLTPAIPTGSVARVLVSSVSSLPKRKVMAVSGWTHCVLRPHLRVSICSHFSRVLCTIRKREHPQSLLSRCNLGCSDLLRNRRRRMFSLLHCP